MKLQAGWRMQELHHGSARPWPASPALLTSSCCGEVEATGSPRKPHPLPAAEQRFKDLPLVLAPARTCHMKVRIAMTPLLNQMSVVGIVSIPGMMTGEWVWVHGAGARLAAWESGAESK